MMTAGRSVICTRFSGSFLSSTRLCRLVRLETVPAEKSKDKGMVCNVKAEISKEMPCYSHSVIEYSLPYHYIPS